MARQYDLLDRFGDELKLGRDYVAKLRSAIEAGVDMVGAVTSVVGAFDTAKGVLEEMGILESAEEESLKLQQEISAGIDKIIQRLSNDTRAAKLEKRSAWVLVLSDAQHALTQLAGSRSEQHVAEASTALNALRSALEAMLLSDHHEEEVLGVFGPVPTAGIVPFLRASYAYIPFTEEGDNRTINREPTHWLDYADSGYLITRGGRSADYALRSADLATDIWDPGHYVDLLVRGTAVYLQLLTQLEPAFRSTGERREEVAGLAAKLDHFAEQWDRQLIVTNLRHAIGDDGRIWHPYDWIGSYGFEGCIAQAAVDPATGLALLDTRYRDGLNSYGRSWRGIEPDDVSRAVIAARARQAAMVEELSDFVGITELRRLALSMRELAQSPFGSQFCRVEWVSPGAPIRPSAAVVDIAVTGPWALPTVVAVNAGTEEITLGDLAGPIGKAGKTYPATRVRQSGGMYARAPLVRRMEISGKQLGYSLTVGIARQPAQPTDLPQPATRTIELWPYSAPSGRPQPSFVELEEAIRLDVPDATVFDVVQSAHLSAADERAWLAGQRRPGDDKVRLLLNRRSGPVSVTVTVSTRIDWDSPDYPFVGHADVYATNADDGARDAYVVGISFTETVVSSATGKPTPIPAGSAQLHVIPSYLLAGREFFEDHLAASLILDSAYLEVVAPDRTIIPRRPELDPRVQDLAVISRHFTAPVDHQLRALHEFGRARPELVRAALAQYRAPEVREG